MDIAFIIEKAVLISVVLGVSLVTAMYTTLAERKIAGFLQDRHGPNRAGPFGLLQPLADGVKLFTKEEIIPREANRFLFVLGPSLAMMMACVGTAVIPWGEELQIGDRTVSLQIADVNVGILYVFGVVALGVYGIMIGGWASNNKYSLLSAIRAASQNISYEISMGLSLIALLMMTGTLSLGEIVEQQRGINWNIWYQPLGFLLFITCSFAETNRNPFDLVECETELVGGYHTEYSSMKLGFFLFAEYINIFVASAVMSTLYFGGYNFPGMDALLEAGVTQNWITLIGTGALLVKILLFIFFFIWVRWTVPRFRYDQLMKLGWNIMIPLAIANIVITGLVMYFTGKI